MAKNQKINHYRRIILEQKISEKSMLPGMLLSFIYNSKGVYDRKPLLFFLYKEGDLIHGINFNYLHEHRIQKFFTISQTITPVIEENLIKLPETYQRLQLSTSKKASSVGSQLLYNTIMPKDKHYKSAYRTYKLSKASSMKVVNYNIDSLSKLKIGQKATVATIRKSKKEDSE
ncbi:MAG: hypothetical protein H8D94_00350 [Candidatus Pelagibacter sp.]|nr:hypothetical protein [Candidatus Pelagibacter sp.]